MLMVFLGTTMAIGASLQLMSGPLSAIVMGSASQNRLAAEELAKSGLRAVTGQLQAYYNGGQTISAGLSFNSTSAPAYVLMPQSPDSPAGATRSVGSYTSRVSYVNGNTLLVMVTATVGSSQSSVSQLLTLTRDAYPMAFNNITGATAAYGLRRLTSSAAITRAIRVRRGRDNAETDIGFLPNGDLDIPALMTFLNDGLTTYPKPLDRVTGAVRAYSLRKINTAYTGNAIIVRRSSDDATTNIGFLPNGDLDAPALLSFCKTDSCFVTAWYDQSGNGRHATQTTLAAQPRIVNAGALEMINGRVALRFDGVDDTMLGATNNTANSSFNLVVAQVDAGASITLQSKATSGTSGTGGQKYLLSPPNAGAVNAGTGISLGENGAGVYEHGNSYMPCLANSVISPNSNDGLVVSYNYINKQPFLFINSKLVDVGFTSPRADLALPVHVGGPPPVHAPYGYFKGAVGEWIQYPTSLTTANRQMLENDEARYYDLTLADPGYTPPLVTVPSATAAYGLRRLITDNTGTTDDDKAIQVRRSSDNTTQIIGFDPKGNLDLANLYKFCGAGSCFVSIWYDQSGNNRHLTQPTAANQPRIVNAGVLDTINGRPAMRNIGSRILLGAGANLMAGTGGWWYSTILADYGSVDTANFLDRNPAGNSNPIVGLMKASGKFGIVTRRNDGTNQTVRTGSYTIPSDGTGQLVSWQRVRGVEYTLFVNGLVDASTPDTDTDITPQGVAVLGHNEIGYYPGASAAMSELIIYNTSVTTATRNRLEGNQMAYYNINNQEPDTGFVTTWYDQSGNGFNFMQGERELQPVIRLDSKTGRPTIQFNGLNNYMATGTTLNFTGTNARALVVASMDGSTGSAGRLFGGKKNSDVYDYATPESVSFLRRYGATNQLFSYRNNATLGISPAFTLNQPFQATSVFNGSSHQIRVNGVNGTSVASSGSFGINQLWLGGAPFLFLGDLWAGGVSEILLYPNAMNAVPLAQLEQDQRSYYGTP
ncbi:arabinofuranosidase catalytic domain-containing protein [Vampirovibrio chlorellavorus]|uniref:arabinofuranosidase catalytic domain-containing protein n=1 Tax=Vampirovibrio chlorellavorus TaxID=758823 RepID=UPI0026EA7737|nr:arabinofuranosidase catalytic domain-containing protein [Vampirovibrio chlorellavorus]